MLLMGSWKLRLSPNDFTMSWLALHKTVQKYENQMKSHVYFSKLIFQVYCFEDLIFGVISPKCARNVGCESILQIATSCQYDTER